jgi:hypothetical protein
MNTNRTERSFEQEAELAIRNAFTELLETKHLYQSAIVSFSKIQSALPKIVDGEFAGRFMFAGPRQPPSQDDIDAVKQSIRKKFDDHIASWTNGEWILLNEKTASGFGSEEERVICSRFAIPSIKTFCTKCDSGPWPHNLARDSGNRGYLFEADEETPHIQVFSLPFQCQNCKKEAREPLVFLIKRDRLKLTLVGRSQFPEVSIPDFIPKEQRKFYRNAIVVSQANFILAATMYLRTLIEQHFYQMIPKADIEAIKKKGSPRGDELAELYAKTLPKGFPSDFPSLRKAYDDLSEVLHRGNEDDEASKKFFSIKTDIEKHFDALRLFNSILKK